MFQLAERRFFLCPKCSVEICDMVVENPRMSVVLRLCVVPIHKGSDCANIFRFEADCSDTRASASCHGSFVSNVSG